MKYKLLFVFLLPGLTEMFKETELMCELSQFKGTCSPFNLFHYCSYFRESCKCILKGLCVDTDFGLGQDAQLPVYF